MPITDQLGKSDSLLGNLTFGAGTNYSGNVFDKSVTSTLTLSQSVARNVDYNLDPSNTLTLNSFAGQSYNLSADNTLVLSHGPDVTLNGNTQQGSTLTLVQTVVVQRVVSPDVSQSLTFTQSAELTNVFNRSVSQTLTLTDAGLRVVPITADSTLTLSQDVSFAKVKNQGIVQSLTLTQSATRLLTTLRTVSQGLPIIQLASRSIARAVSITASLTLNQSVTVTSSKMTSDTLTFTQTADVVMVKRGQNALSLTQIASVSTTLTRKLYSNLIPFQVVTAQKQYKRDLTQPLSLVQTVTAILTKNATTYLTLNHEVLYDLVTPAFSTLVIEDIAFANFTRSLLPSNQLFLRQNIQVQKSRAVGTSNALGMNQFARGTKVLSVSPNNTLILQQDLVRDRTLETLEDTLSFDQTAVGQKIASRSVSNQLVLGQSLQLSKTINRSLTDTLAFKNRFSKYVGLPGGKQYVDVPEIQVVKVQSLVILQSEGQVITLMAPEFNDKEAGTSRVNIKRAMDGTRRIYKRATVASRLVYDFVMDRVKAIELRSFLLANNSKVITMTNWKGEIWAVVLTNSPFSFTEDAYRGSPWGNRSTITLEFEGVRLN